MSHYRFTAFDSSGKEHAGTVQAATAQDAAKQLVAQGLRVRMISEVKAGDGRRENGNGLQATGYGQTPLPSGNPKSKIQNPKLSPSPPSPPVARRPSPVAPAPSPQIINTPAPRPTSYHTATGTDKDRYFLFSQISQALRSGLNPANFFNEIAPRTKGIYRGSLQHLAGAATEGIPMSTVMAQYPDLYPPHVIGAMRAGEQGVFLPEAAEMIAQQAEQAHKFKRWFWFVWGIIFNGLIAVPGVLLFRSALLKMVDTQMKGGETTSQKVLADLTSEMWHSLLWPYGPATLLVCILLYAFWKYMGARASLPFRHKLGLAWPVFGKRARSENLTIFSWTMSKLSASGLPHQTSWDLAAGSVPNIEMQAKLMDVGRRVANSEKIADAVFASDLFPKEYAPMIATAEYTGSIPATMDQLSKASRTEYEAQQNYAKLRGAGWGCLVLGVTSAFVLGVVLYAWYYEVYDRILREFKTD